MRVGFHVLIGFELTLLSSGVHLKIKSLRLDLHLQHLLKCLEWYWYPDPDCLSPYSSTKQTKVILSHLPLILFFSHSPFWSFQSPKKPKNKIQNKNRPNQKPKPKNKKNTLWPPPGSCWQRRCSVSGFFFFSSLFLL